MRIAVVTGASSGFGREFVKQIEKRYKKIDEIWVIARREDRLNELASEIKNKAVRVIPLDLTNRDDIAEFRSMLSELNPSIRILVNNAGFGKIGLFDELAIEDQDNMIELNCNALVAMTYASIPYLSKKANIIQVASSAAFLPQPRFAIYAATKSFVLSFSRAINRELKDRGVTVTAVCPGPADTEFFDVASTTDDIKIYKKFFMAEASKVVDKALRDANDGKEISTYGFSMNAFKVVAKYLPHRWILPFIK